MTSTKSAVTSGRILDAALELFRTKGFDETTMRDIATAAGMATGAAYHHFPSKDAMVLAFYERSWDDMQPLLESAVTDARGFQEQLVALIRTKLEYFQPNRTVLKALLRSGADPQNPLSPFSRTTRAIRAADVEWFRRTLETVRVPADLAAHLPDALWLFQMGVIYFWVIDTSPKQKQTQRLLDHATALVALLIRLASTPLARPLRKPAIELITLVKGES